MKEVADKVKFVKISEIKEGTRFRKDLGDILSLVESIREKGVIQPITVSTDFTLLAGQRRLTAAKEAGLAQIPALIREIKGEVDLREIELIENLCRLDFSYAERAALVKEIDRLYQEKHMDWSGRKTANLLNRGHSSVARDIKLANAIELMPEIALEKTADDAHKMIAKVEERQVVGELRRRQSLPGLDKGVQAMLALANANYRVGDTFKGLAEMPSDGLSSIIECDPPYGIDLTNTKRGKEEPGAIVQTYNEVSAVGYDLFLGELCRELYRVASPSAFLVFWFGPTWHTQVMSNLRAAGWLVDDIPCIWAKQGGQTMHPEYYLARTYEPFFLCRKGKPILNQRGRSNVFSFSGETGKYHPTQRPISLMQDLLSTLGVELQTVLVPFLGSGVTLRAAYKCGMRASGWDMSGEYKDKFLLAVEEDAKTEITIGKLDKET